MVVINTDNIVLENMYIFEANESQKMVYISNFTSKTYPWSHTEHVIKMKGEKEKTRNILINITEERFYLFLLRLKREVKGSFKCCNQTCDFQWELSNKALNLTLTSGFDYDKENFLCVNYDRFIKSVLKLRFLLKTEDTKSIIGINFSHLFNFLYVVQLSERVIYLYMLYFLICKAFEEK